MLKSRAGEIKTKEEWEQEVNSFWDYAENQNKYICGTSLTTNKRAFKRPPDAFKRFARIIGLQEIEE